MKSFVTLLLILLLAGLGPVSGAIAHAHDVHSSDDHAAAELSTSPHQAVRGAVSHHPGDEGVVHAQAERALDHSTFEAMPADYEGETFHLHKAMDGAPDGAAAMKFVIDFTPISRSLENSDQIIGPVPAILPRPPKQIL